jgi:hypothetical protein
VGQALKKKTPGTDFTSSQLSGLGQDSGPISLGCRKGILFSFDQILRELSFENEFHFLSCRRLMRVDC